MRCPHCDFDYTHQEGVEVYFRKKEDAEIGVHASVSALGVLVKDDQEDNPSSRRDGVRIKFRCENCHALTGLLIYQHKGQTFIESEVIHPDYFPREWDL